MSSKKEMREQSKAQVEQRVLGNYYEIVDFANDPIMNVFYSHVKAALLAFANDQSGNEKVAINKYLFLFRRGAALLFRKFGLDYVEWKKQLDREDLSEGEKLLKEMEKIAELLEQRARKIQIVLRFTKKGVIDFAREMIEEDKEADKIDEEMLKDEEEVVLSEEDVLEVLEESAEEEVEVDPNEVS